MIKRFLLRFVAVSVIFIVLLIFLAVMYLPNIELWVSEKKNLLKIFSHEKTTLAGISTNEYERITIYKWDLPSPEVVSRNINSLTEDGCAHVVGWLSAEHGRAMPSLADFAPDYRIIFVPKSPSTHKGLNLITIQRGFAIVYDYETNQYLRLIDNHDRRLIRMLDSEMSRDTRAIDAKGRFLQR